MSSRIIFILCFTAIATLYSWYDYLAGVVSNMGFWTYTSFTFKNFFLNILT